MYHGPLVSGFVNISVYFNKLVNKLNHLIDFLKKTKILLVIQSENYSATSSFSDQLLMMVSTVLRAEIILESQAEVYSNKFMIGNSPLQCSAQR